MSIDYNAAIVDEAIVDESTTYDNANTILIAKYKFDGSVYANLIPEFNAEFTNYTITDEVDSENSNHIIRTIESDSLPTLMRFGATAKTPRSSSLLTIEHLNTSECTTLDYLCAWCDNLSEFNCNLDTSKVKGAYSCFHACSNLSTLNVTSWDTTNFIGYGAYGIFAYCEKLSELDLSNWILDNCNVFARLFEDNKSLTRLDISNLNLNKATNITSMFGGNINNLTDIGMIYCDQSTINKVASLLPTDHNITIWVESDDILQYDQYDHITYKTQKVQDTVHLNSPLLKGDTIEVIDGKTYHVHRWEKIVLDGSEGWWEAHSGGFGNLPNTFRCACNFPQGKSQGNNMCDKVKAITSGTSSLDEPSIQVTDNYLYLRLWRINANTVSDFVSYLNNNNITYIYELATPHYELISEEPLELTLLDTTDNTINNNSILPSNMTIANKELSTIAIKPSTTYTLSFDKSNEDSEVTIDICGGQQITTVLNRIELTTPSELGSGIRFISSDGCIISNVRLLEGSLVKEAIPKETFEGLKSSFEEGYIIGENLVDRIITNVGQYGAFVIIPVGSLKPSTNYTLILRNNGKYINGYVNEHFFEGAAADRTFNINTNNYFIRSYKTLDSINVDDNRLLKSWDAVSNIDIEVIFLEGDHTHLSKTELMRYIEKGTSHYEEEDYNHVGKYKVEYKVTGKNKFDKNKELQAINYKFDSQNYQVDFNDDYIRVKYGLYGGAVYLGSIGSFKKGTYAVSCECYSETLGTADIFIGYFVNDNWKGRKLYQISFNTWEKFKYTFTLENDTDSLYLQIQALGSSSKYENIDFRVRNIQLEEGTVATEYEPYKEDIKTYYLSSPLLEGDTIEDINGVATHVKRYGKVILDGSENWADFGYADDTLVSFKYAIDNTTGIPTYRYIVSDRFKTLVSHETRFENWSEGIALHGWTCGNVICISKSKLSTPDINGFKQWLQANPTTAVYELAEPVYEPISDESILLDSYTNGHLDLSNENIPIEKVKFINWYDNLKYLQSNTRYIVQFESDNAGKLDTLGVGGSYLYNQNVVKGLNEFILTTNNTPTTTLSVAGIGFNISNIQVVATDRDVDFDYFKGLQSSFENGLVADVNDENYGKYKVECKIVGKNKININKVLDVNSWTASDSYHYIKLQLKPNTDYIISKNKIPSEEVYLCISQGHSYREGITNIINGGWILHPTTPQAKRLSFGFTTPISGVVYLCTGQPNSLKEFILNLGLTFQLEEGTQATSYEPYKESIHTLYLNSPLLKGDKLVVHNGKLCHYHKMGMVVLDGSENWEQTTALTNTIRFNYIPRLLGDNTRRRVICNNIDSVPFGAQEDIEGICNWETGRISCKILKSRLLTTDTTGFKQWLQDNPTTVVYELAEPYYEPIEPQLSQYSFSTVKDGDMDIVTVLPIEKINLTYRTDINGVSSIEEQIASIQEGTDISSIIDEEVDE